MSISIQRAATDHAPGIVELGNVVWPDESTDAAHIARVIAKRNHVLIVALHAQKVVGFVDGFSTLSRQGVSRWEVDLLAVHPNYRGQRLGQRLLEACTAGGRQTGAAVARGLIQVDNIASQRTFARCGYHRDDTIYQLCVSWHQKPVTRDPNLFKGLHLIPVETFNYRGLWLEGDFTAAEIRAAQAALHDGDWDLVGAVIPEHQIASKSAAKAAGFIQLGQYQWWLFAFSVPCCKDSQIPR